MELSETVVPAFWTDLSTEKAETMDAGYRFQHSITGDVWDGLLSVGEKTCWDLHPVGPQIALPHPTIRSA